MRRPRAIALLVVLVGLLGTVQAVRSHQSDTQFVAQQRILIPVSPGALSGLLMHTNDPRPGNGNGLARSAVCRPLGGGQLRNPWSCVVTYPRPPSVLYRVDVASDGSLQGQSPGRPLSVHGCCVAGAAG